MKTVIDAVNDLKGDLGNVIVTDTHLGFKSILKGILEDDNCKVGCYYDYYCTNEPRGALRECFEFICSIEEFNQCVAEMSEGLFVPEANKTNLVYDKDGNRYELNTLYETIDGTKVVLDAIVDRVGFKVSRLGDKARFWIEDKLLVTNPIVIGAITPPKVKLVDGQTYMFEHLGNKFVGFYNEKFSTFSFSRMGSSIKLLHATNITPLIPETKD